MTKVYAAAAVPRGADGDQRALTSGAWKTLVRNHMKGLYSVFVGALNGGFKRGRVPLAVGAGIQGTTIQ